jgi:arylsulfatase A-like enzyme
MKHLSLAIAIVVTTVSAKALAADPAPKPAKPERFSIVGLIDLNGDGKSDRALLHRLVNRAGAVIDNEIDDEGRRTGKGITTQTKLLLVGEIPDPDTVPANDRETARRIVKQYRIILAEARKHGVRVIAFSSFLPYRHNIGRFDRRPLTPGSIGPRSQAAQTSGIYTKRGRIRQSTSAGTTARLFGGKQSLRRPNILFLLADDQRPDTIAALGNSVIKTPNLDRLVRRGTVFTRAVCANPICTPSRAEIMTGQSGFRSGIRDFGGRFQPGTPFWAETLRKAGYRTGYVGKWHNAGRPSQCGYEETPGLYSGGGGKWFVPTFDWNGRPVTGYRGWMFQSDDRLQIFPERGVGLQPGISADFADAAIGFLKKKSDRPFFLHVNFTAPHDPLLMPFGYEKMYDPAKMPVPKNFLPRHPFDHGNFSGRDEKLFEWPRTKAMVQRELAVYYAVISHLDAQVGRIMKALEETDQRKNTIVIYSSDHGLAIGSHGLRGKQNMYEHTIGVPLIMSGPGIIAGWTVTGQCYLRDIFPTTCDLVGVPIPKNLDGRSLKPLLERKLESIHPYVFGYFRNFQRMIRTDEWKLIHYPHLDRYQLFHLKTDPAELHDVANEKNWASVRKDLNRKLLDWQKSVHDPALTVAPRK